MDTIAEKVFQGLTSSALEEFKLLWNAKDDAERMKNTVSAIKATLLVAESKAAKDHQVTLAREIMTRNKIAKKVRIFFSASNQVVYNLKMGHKMREINKRLDDIDDDRKKLQSLNNYPVDLAPVPGAEGSMIIVTTRSETVGKIMGTYPSIMLKGLDEERSWKLFCTIAFEEGKEPTNMEVVDIAKKIVKRCKGVPLAIRTIGRLLYSRTLEETGNGNLPKSIGNLKHLRYLHFQHEWIGIPRVFSRLHNLQTLKLSGDLFPKFARGINKLVNLRHLELNRCGRSMPHGLGQLTSLQTLTNFVLHDKKISRRSGIGGISELGSLNNLRGCLKLEGLVFLRDYNEEEAAFAKLQQKQHL
ncbi:putative disease resistance protein RGA4 [Senna tora]|uniref:Putative disease resistance protein RGA4 n=1 Tax=Senna tora TaxID=362788 RepID=A0A834SWL1_9FABA|nr:putative disease resistance protein RGA4 [Senna tora]